MKKSNLIVEFQKKFDLPDVKWNKFLSEIEEGIPLKDICEKFNLNYNATRYLFYSLSLDLSSKSRRKQSILELHKDLAKEMGMGYDLVEELEKELEVPHFFESDPDSPSSEKRNHPKFDRPQSLDIPAFKIDHKD